MTLDTLEHQIEERLSKAVPPAKSVWAGLVDSARSMRGGGCDGTLLSQAVKCGLDILAGKSDPEIQGVWEETENGMTAMAEDEAEPDRVQMLMDIEIELHESLCRRACAQA